MRKIKVKEKDQTYAIRLYVDGKRKYSANLIRKEAKIFSHALKHLEKFLYKYYLKRK